MVEAKNLRKEYVMGRVRLEVLKGVSLQLAPHSFLAVMGPSGAGKSTLLHLLAGLDVPTSGEVLWEGRPVSRLPDSKRAEFRNQHIGVVFQFYHLLPELSALENVLLPSLVGRSRQPRRQLQERARGCLHDVGLSARVSHRPRELSGGEQQRVAIARALMNQPELLLCDEPTGNLDSKTGAEVIEVLAKLHQQGRVGLLLVTHHARLAELAETVIAMEDGRVVNNATQTEISGQKSEIR